MRRYSLVVLMVLLVVVATSVASANLLGALSFPLWSEQTTIVTAGVNSIVTFHKEVGDRNSGYYKSGFLEIPASRYSLTDCTKWMAVEPVVLGIKPEQIKRAEVVFKTGSDDSVCYTEGKFWINIQKLRLRGMLHRFDIEVTHTASRKDERFFIFFKHHVNIEKTDKTVMLFGVRDYDQEILNSCAFDHQKTVEQVLADYQRFEELRSAIYAPLLAITVDGVFLGHDQKAQSLALRAQGFPAVFADRGPDPAIAEYQKALSEIQTRYKELADKFDALNKPTPAPAPAAPVTVEKFDWKLVLPAGSWGLNTSVAGRERSFTGPYSGTVTFRGAVAGEVLIQLKGTTTWRSVMLTGPCTVKFEEMEVR